jgi:CrcB protein
MPETPAPRHHLLGLVVLGGIVGSLLRLAVTTLIGVQAFPWATIVVNVSGSLGVGWSLPTLHSRTRRRRRVAFGAVGLAATYTTLATFAVDAVTLAREGRVAAAAGYVVLSVGGALVAAAVGHRWGER